MESIITIIITAIVVFILLRVVLKSLKLIFKVALALVLTFAALHYYSPTTLEEVFGSNYQQQVVERISAWRQ